jgi:hypothetical protein
VATNAPEQAPATTGRTDMLEIIDKLGDVGSVELKMSVPSEQLMGLRTIKADPLTGVLREVVFFDTPDLTLYKNGIVLRGRRTQQKQDDTVVKLRPCVPADLTREIRSSPNLKVEMDVTASGHVVSSSLQGARPAGTMSEVLEGKMNLGKFFTKEQRSFLVDRWPDGLGWDDLVPLGPAYVILIKAVPLGYSRKLTLEIWHFPGELPLVELSTKGTPTDIFVVRKEILEYLGSRGLKATGEQEPKTRKALEFFAAHRPPVEALAGSAVLQD